MWLALLTLTPGLHAAPVGGTERRLGMGLHAGLGGGLTAKLYLTDKVAVSAATGLWSVLLRRSSLLAEVDVYTVRFDAGSLVATAAGGLARESDFFWRGEKTWGVRLATSSVWRWQDRPFEVGAELGVELYNYNLAEGQLGELITATALIRLYPGWGS